MMDAKIVTAEEVKVQIETLQGPQGERGAQGPQGERGERGPQGIQGPAGARGEKGDRGERGEKGATGERGPQGLPGRDGADGRDGATGARGPQGAQGLQGERGEPGPAGRDGVDGIQGFSPIVDLERLDDGVLITVQNKDGNKIAKVQDGKDAVGADDLFIVNFGNGYPEPDKTRSEIVAAAEEGKVVLGVFDGVVYSYIGMTPNPMDQDVKTPTFSATVSLEERKFNNLQFALEGEMVDPWTNDVELNQLSNLRFTGAVNAVYNGSEYVEVKIPTGGSGGGSVGPQGPAGADGYSPTVTLSRIENGVEISVQNKTGTQTATVYDGKDGEGGEGGGLPEGGEPNTMLVTDGEGNAKWDERTHWKEDGVIDYFPAAKVSFNGGFGNIATPFAQPLVEGETYTVTIDGVDHVSVANGFNNNGNIFLLLGNGGAFGAPDTGEPFGLMYVPPELLAITGGTYGILVGDMGGASEVTLRVWKDGTIYHKLAPEFLPIPLTSGAVDVLPEMTIGGEEGDLSILTPFASEIVVGKTYMVTYNGTDYTCTAFPLQEGEGAPIMPTVGNQAVIDGEDTGEPFVIAYIPPEIIEMVGAYGIVMDMTGASSATVRIQGEGGVKIAAEALDLDWIPKFENVGELILKTAAEEQIPVILNISLEEKVSVGDKVVVVSDGDFYNLVVKEADGVAYIGNASINLGEDATDSGEPFFIASMGSETFIRYEGVNNDIHEIELYKAGDSQRIAKEKLPKEFLPDTSALHVVITKNDDETYSSSHTAQDIYKAFTENRAIFCSYDQLENALGIRVFSLVEVGKFTSVFSRFNGGEEEIFTLRSIDGSSVDYEVKEYIEGDIDSIADAVIAKIPSAEGVGF